MRRAILLGLAVVAVAIAIGTAINSRRDRFTFTVTFIDANGIRAGQDVYYQRTKIGEVAEVDDGSPTAVTVRLEREHEQTVHRQMSFFVEREALLSRDRRLVAYDCGLTEAAGPLNRGEVIAGNENTAAWLACKGSNHAGLFGGAAATLLAKLASSDGGRALFQAIRDYSESARQMSEREWETFRRERLPELERQARALKERLEKDGRLEEARRFWEQFRAWVEQMLKRET